MPLSTGTRLGPYEILAPIGAGGMGEVYKARDTRLDRIVAIKVSKEKFSERFEREARAVAALNHSHICTLHDVGPNYLVMEYIDGTPLKGPLPVGDALRLAAQIAGALDAAHRKGIIHRDLKPGNILVTKSGVKLLDFGLAKTAPALTAEDATQTMALTEAGMILGTLQYMSPEQLEGKEADPRSDIFSFGLVLYELLAGTRPFPASTQAGLIVAILKEEPRPLRSQHPNIPPALDRTLSKCLAKDPDERWQSARDLKAELEWIATGNSAPDLVAHPLAVSRRSLIPRMLGAAVAALVLLSIVLGAWLWRSTRLVGQPLVKLDLDLGAPVSPLNAGSDAILSPDGTRLVFVSQGSDGKSHLSTRRLDQAKVTELANTQGAYGPFFSPDGQWLGFFSPGKLKKLPVEGGDPVTLCDAPAGRGASWGPDDNIIAALETRAGLSRVPASGGTVTQFTQLDFGAASHRWPQILPGGKAVVFTSSRLSGNFSEASVAVASLVDGRSKVVLDRVGPFPHYLASGHLVYISKGTLFAVPFDLERLEVHGTPAPILEGVSYSFAYGFAQLDVSRKGEALYRSGKATGLFTLKWLDSTGNTEPMRSMPASYQSPRLSPDGNLLAFTLTDGSAADIWVYDLHRDIPLRLTNGQGSALFPAWSPDSRYVVFQSAGGMFWARADGGGTPQQLTESKDGQRPGSFAPDGKRLVFAEYGSDGRSEIKTVPIESGPNGLRAGKQELFLSIPSASPYPVFAPDGKWIAYASTEAGAYEVYVRAFPDNGSRKQISNAGGVMPRWSRNHELFYRTEDQHIMVVNYAVKGDSFEVDNKPRPWSNTQLANSGQTINLDIAPDGKHFAVVMPAENLEPNETKNHVTLLLNFSDEVRRRLTIK